MDNGDEIKKLLLEAVTLLRDNQEVRLVETRQRRRRRKWTDAQKRAILEEARKGRLLVGGVTEVINKYGIEMSHLSNWRKQLDISCRLDDQQEPNE